MELIMKYGYFDDANREYVITDPRTPTKWINYIGTLDFGGFVDHTGGSLICKSDPTFNRITKYIQQMPSSDFKGETLYLRLHTDLGFNLISPFFVPSLDPLDKFECHVGLGYSRIVSECHGVGTDATIFVPEEVSCEVRRITVTNISNKPIVVDAVPVVEYTHPDALKQFTNADWIPQTMQSRMVMDNERTILLQYPFMFKDIKVNYFAASLPASSFETDRKRFLGENEYGTWRSPRSLFASQLSNTQAERGDNISALMIPLGFLEPGSTRTFTTMLGQEPSLKEIIPVIRKYSELKNVDLALDHLKKFWDKYLSITQVETPDASMNSMINIHNPHQCYTTRQWSRYLSYYQLGLGARGIGIRDSSQDILGVVSSIPEQSRDFILTLISFQKRNGSSMHSYNPLTLEGSLGDSVEMEDRPHYYSDDHLWSVLTVTSYIKETGDFDILKLKVPFYEKDKNGRAVETGSVLEHLERALRYTRKDTGRHGLPLLGFADWNDTINLPKGAESLFTAYLYGKVLLEFIDLLGHLGNKKKSYYLKAYEEMKTCVEKSAWDGKWYVMYLDDKGKPVGSSRNEKGKIHLNAQSWAVISGFASPRRAMQAMDSVHTHLNTKYGIKLSTPGYNGFDPKYGGVTTYPPGAKENGGIFLHPNPWAMIAETLLGNGDRAFEYYSQINPAEKNNLADLYEIEPYVYAQNILGDEHPQFGLGRNSWLSGTASWSYQAGVQWILGVRAEYGGLRIDPCIPTGWDGFRVNRKFHGCEYEIQVHNVHHVSKGVTKMTINSKEIPGNLIPDGYRGNYKVEVWLG
jgi:cellobiose phosphorylase